MIMYTKEEFIEEVKKRYTSTSIIILMEDSFFGMKNTCIDFSRLAFDSVHITPDNNYYVSSCFPNGTPTGYRLKIYSASKNLWASIDPSSDLENILKIIYSE